MICGVALRKNSWLVLCYCLLLEKPVFVFFLSALFTCLHLSKTLFLLRLSLFVRYSLWASPPPPRWYLPVSGSDGILPSSWFYSYSCVFSSACGIVGSLRVDSWPAVDALPVLTKGIEKQVSVCLE